jgi:hypothetical protein
MRLLFLMLLTCVLPQLSQSDKDHPILDITTDRCFHSSRCVGEANCHLANSNNYHHNNGCRMDVSRVGVDEVGSPRSSRCSGRCSMGYHCVMTRQGNCMCKNHNQILSCDQNNVAGFMCDYLQGDSGRYYCACCGRGTT